MPQKKVVIVLDKEQAEEFLKSVNQCSHQDTDCSDIINEITIQLTEIDKPEQKQIVKLGSTEFSVRKEYCPKCGFQVYPKIHDVKCLVCKWKGLDNDLIYKPTEQGGDEYINHCPECDSIKIKRLKENEPEQSK